MKRTINGRIKIPGSLFPCIACIFIVINYGGFPRPTSTRISLFANSIYLPEPGMDDWAVAYSTILASGLRSSTLATFVGWHAMIPQYSGVVVALGYWHT
jgi:hypothetical protein